MHRLMDLFKTRSIIRYMIIYLIVAASMVMAAHFTYTAIKAWYEERAFFTIDNIANEYSKELSQENYTAISVDSHPGYAMMVFSPNSLVYSSDSRIDLKVTDINYIADYYGNYIYDCYYTETNGEVYYTIIKKMLGSQKDGFTLGESYCKLDSNYNILEGDLFQRSYRLDEYRINLMSGKYKDDYIVEKYFFLTETGENRALILFTPYNVLDTYSTTEGFVSNMWWLPIFVAIVIILSLSIDMEKRIHRALLPLNRAIVAYGQGRRSEIGHPETIPQEFQSVIYNFNALLDQLEQAKEDKKIAEDEKNTIIASLSHDLKTPLTVISSYSKALGEGIVPEDQVDTYLQTIYGRAIYTSNLITELFEYTKMEHPDYSAELMMIDYAEFCNEVCGEKYSEIEAAGFEMSIDIPAQSIMMMLDPQLMQRVFENLIGNSLKYNEKGTKIFVKVTKVGREVRTIIADDGVGIPPEVGKDIFKPFVRGDMARDSGKGTGLGMAVVKKIVELNKGSIKLLNPPDKGYSCEYVITFELEKGKE